MRASRVSFCLLVAATVAGILWLLFHRPNPQVVILPDGSRFTLLDATYGRRHVYRLGNRWQDFLYPVLPAKWRAKFAPRVLVFDSYNRESLMVWFRRDGLPSAGGATTPLYLSGADALGLESPLQLMAHTTRTTGALTTNTSNTPTQFSGWQLTDFPRRSRQFRVIAYRPANDKLSRVGEFLVRNPARRNFPRWTAETLPAVRRTNGLEVTLTRLETGLSGVMSGTGLRIPARVFSRATFKLTENGAPTENWIVKKIRLSSATGETRLGDSQSSQWSEGECTADVAGGIWLEEPAWKVAVDFARSAAFPAADLWGIKAVPMPRPGERVDHRVETNLHAVTLEFTGVSGLKAAGPADPLRAAYVVVLVRTPHPLDRLHVALVEVRDDRGRVAQVYGSTNAISTGSGGNTPKESLTGFRLALPEGARSLDITLAATPIRHVEFLAKPTLTQMRPGN